MRKIYAMMALFVGFAFAQCSSDDDSGASETTPTGTLFVNGEVFPIGENAPGNSFNSMIRSSSGGVNTMAFTILKNANLTSPETIVFSIQDEGTAPANHIYPFVDDSGVLPDVFAVGHYTMPGGVMFGSPNISGSVKVTAVGNDVYRLEFDNVVMEDEDNPASTKTITGYCEMKFMVVNF